jgi:hypothetical protein
VLTASQDDASASSSGVVAITGEVAATQAGDSLAAAGVVGVVAAVGVLNATQDDNACTATGTATQPEAESSTPSGGGGGASFVSSRRRRVVQYIMPDAPPVALVAQVTGAVEVATETRASVEIRELESEQPIVVAPAPPRIRVGASIAVTSSAAALGVVVRQEVRPERAALVLSAATGRVCMRAEIGPSRGQWNVPVVFRAHARAIARRLARL